jgi:hypothetical protein
MRLSYLGYLVLGFAVGLVIQGVLLHSAEAAQIGVQVHESADWRIRVLRVLRSSPADRAGMRTGDEILTVDGKRLWDETPEQVTRMLEGTAGTRVRIEWVPRNSGERREASIDREDYREPAPCLLSGRYYLAADDEFLRLYSQNSRVIWRPRSLSGTVGGRKVEFRLVGRTSAVATIEKETIWAEFQEQVNRQVLRGRINGMSFELRGAHWRLMGDLDVCVPQRQDAIL